MKIRLADYVADFLVSHGITDCFTVTGGGAMHLNDALGHKEGLHCLYNHHEQACAIAAEAYARIHNRIAAVCVTTGPGGTNAITGVLGGWLDSIPMLILQGEDDIYIRSDDIQNFHRINEQSELVTIPGTSHRFLEEGAWDMVLDLTRDWFDFEQVLLM